MAAAKTSAEQPGDNIIPGVSLMQVGPARGHTHKCKNPVTGNLDELPVCADAETLKMMGTLAQSFKGGIKALMGHDAGVDGIIGRLTNFRVEGETLRADLEMNPHHADYQSLVWSTEKLAHNFGFSAAFSGKKEVKDGKAFMRPSELYSFDLEPETAATPTGLMSMGESVDSTTDDNMSAEILAKLSEMQSGITALTAKCTSTDEEMKKMKAKLAKKMPDDDEDADLKAKLAAELKPLTEKLTAQEGEIEKLRKGAAESSKADLANFAKTFLGLDISKAPAAGTEGAAATATKDFPGMVTVTRERLRAKNPLTTESEVMSAAIAENTVAYLAWREKSGIFTSEKMQANAVNKTHL